MLIGIFRSQPAPDYGYIAGQAQVLGAPSGGHVLDLFTREPRVWIRSTLSSPLDGSFAFPALQLGVEYNVEGRHATREYEDRIVGAVEASTRPMLSDATVVAHIGLPFEYRIPVSYGVAPVTYTITGSLPSGITESDGWLVASWPTGTPGSYPVSVEVGGADEQTRTATITVQLVLLPLEIVTPLPALVDGVPASVALVARGGEGPYTFAVTSGALPAGLSLNGSTGEISGTPTTPGAYSFDITVTDVRSATASRAYSGTMTGARTFWRVLCAAADNNAYCVVSEVEFNGVQATGGTATASSIYGGAWTAAAAFDGVKNTDAGWSTATGAGAAGAWIAYEYASALPVNSVSIYAGSPGNQTHSPRDFSVQSSDDGVTWTTEWSVTGATGWAAYEQRTFHRP